MREAEYRRSPEYRTVAQLELKIRLRRNVGDECLGLRKLWVRRRKKNKGG